MDQMFSITKVLNDLDVEFGKDDHDVFAYAPDLARALKYSSTQKMLQVVDDEDKGSQIRTTQGVRNPYRLEAGQPQRLTRSEGTGQRRKTSIIYRDGILELVYRSTLPEAKRIKKQISQILRELEDNAFVLDEERLVNDPTKREYLRARLDSIETRNTFTDVLQAVHSVSNTSQPLSIWMVNFTKLVTTKATGMTSTAYTERRQAAPGKNFRKVATSAELRMIESAESLLVAMYIKHGAESIKEFYQDSKGFMEVFN